MKYTHTILSRTYARLDIVTLLFLDLFSYQLRLLVQNTTALESFNSLNN